MHPLISIIIPCYNKKEFIYDLINSIMNQSYDRWELILIDDFSTDGTRQFLEGLVNKSKKVITIFNSKNKGANFCRNKGLELSQGDFMFFFDADDLMSENCLENRVKALNDNPGIGLLVFNMGVFTSDIGDQPKSKNWIVPDGNTNLLSLFFKHQIPWGTPQVLWKKDIIESLGGFNLNYTRLQDVELHTRALLRGFKVKTFPESSLDIHYRIDESRINFKKDIFYQRFVDSCVQYYQDFYILIFEELLSYMKIYFYFH